MYFHNPYYAEAGFACSNSFTGSSEASGRREPPVDATIFRETDAVETNTRTKPSSMKIAVGADHAGFDLKNVLAEDLRRAGYEVLDVGTYSAAPVDYPDFAEAVGNAVNDGRAERGILICGSGVGACVAANKIKGIRAGICHDNYSAHQGVEHDDMNVLVLGSRITGVEVARELAAVYVRAKFSGEERHVRRLKKVAAIEAKYSK